MLDECLIVAVHVTIDFLDDCLLKFCSIILLDCLVIVHDIPYHFSMEGNGMTHALMEAHVLVMSLIRWRNLSQVGYVVPLLIMEGKLNS